MSAVTIDHALERIEQNARIADAAHAYARARDAYIRADNRRLNTWPRTEEAERATYAARGAMRDAHGALLALLAEDGR